VGVDTHRDTHHVEISLPTGTPIATCSISNDTSGYAQLLAWIHNPPPQPRPVHPPLPLPPALTRDTTRLPIPRADGDREALRILLGARHDLTVTSTAQINRLRALLRDGNDTDHQLARAALTDATPTGLARRRLPRDASREQAVRHAEVRRLALAIHNT